MPFYNFSVVLKKIMVIRVICFFWLAAKIISWRVWLAYRLFPIVPPLKFLIASPGIHLILFIFSILALASLMIFPANRILQVSVVIIEVLSCALDQNRWQPWEYQYVFITLAMTINYKSEKNMVSTIAFIIASVYFFSGLGKINPLFSLYFQHKILLSKIFYQGHSAMFNLWLYHAGYLAGVIEVLSGIGLFFQSTRKIAVVFLIVMHLLILVIYGPFAINHNVIIWPWNIAMILILSLFFLCKTPVSVSFQLLITGWNKLILVLFGILPALNFFGYWDFYLSSSLFSSRTPDMYICIHTVEGGKILQPFFANYKNKFLCDSNSILLNVRTWSLREMQVPVYPEIRIYRNIREQLLKKYPGMKATFMVYHYVNGLKERVELK